MPAPSVSRALANLLVVAWTLLAIIVVGTISGGLTIELLVAIIGAAR